MKKFFTILVAALAIAQASVAQKELAQIELSNFKFPSKAIDRVTPALDAIGGACFSLEHGNFINFAVLSPAGEVIVPAKEPLFLSGSINMLGATSRAGRYTFFTSLKEGDSKLLFPYLVDKATGEAKRVRAIELAVEKDSRYVTKVEDGNVVYLFFFQKQNNLLQVCTLKDVEDITVRNYTVDFPNASGFFKASGDWTVLKKHTQNTIFSTHSKKKIYKEGHKLTFVYDKFNYNQSTTAYFTQLVSLDMQEEQVAAKTFSFMAAAGDYSTYLHQNKLFKFTVRARDLKLEVFDVASQHLLRNYSYLKSEPIAIKASPLYTKDAGTFKVEENETTDTGLLLRKLSRGAPAVTVASANPNTFALKLGSYFVPSSGGGGMVRPMGGGTIATPGGAVSVAPSYAYMGGAGGSGYGISTYFNTYLDATTLESTKAIPMGGEEEMLEQYNRQLQLQEAKVGAAAITEGKTMLLYTYVDKKTKQLKIVSFSN